MKLTELPAETLLQRSFLFGIIGIILGTLSILNSNMGWLEAPMGPLNGVSIGLQILGLSLAVLVLRKRNLSKENKEKSQKMTLVLGVALLFFILSI